MRSLNRLSQMVETSGTSSYGYDLNGNILTKTLPNGDTDTYVFDALNRASSQTATAGGGASLYTYGYHYDPVGNVMGVTETYPGGLSNRTVTNTYDSLYRLLSEADTISGATTTTSYTYDAGNNRLTKTAGGTVTTYTYNAGNQLISTTSGDSYVYDANGSRIAHSSGGNTDTYGYDFENRLVGLAKTISGTGITTGTYAYAYDYRTRRVLRDETGAGSGAKTQLVFSGGTTVQEYTVSGTTGTLSVEYIRGSDYGGGVGGVLYTLRSGTSSYTHENRRGDVVAKTGSTGSLTYQAAYEAFGKRPQEAGSTQDRQKANTKDEDPTGLLNEGFRYRDLDTGSFITKDPAGFVDGPNLYTYVKQNPWTHFDPEGLASDLGPDGKFHPEAKLYHVQSDPKNPDKPIVTPVTSAKDIKTKNATIFINGMNSDLEGSAKTGLRDTGKSDFYMIHNPTNGFVADFVDRCIPERFGAHLAVDNTTRDILKGFDLPTASVFAHSQGAMILNHALDDINHEGTTKTQGMKAYYDGSPANYFASKHIVNEAGGTIERFTGNPLDAVHNIVGLNTPNPLRIGGSLLAAPLLFGGSDWSPHTPSGGGSHVQGLNENPLLH